MPRLIDEAEIRRIAFIAHRVAGVLQEEHLRPEQCVDVLSIVLGRVIYCAFETEAQRREALEWCAIALENALETAGEAFGPDLVVYKGGKPS